MEQPLPQPNKEHLGPRLEIVDDKPAKLSYKWILLGILAIILMWLISSYLY